MMDEHSAEPSAMENTEFRFQNVGEQLRAARTAKGLTLNEVAAQTRVPMRHLEAIEQSDFGALPGSTYSVGFTKAYARVVGLDAAKLSDELRLELAQGGHSGFVPASPAFEPTDPSRVPPRWLAWTAATLAVLGLIGYFYWRSATLSVDADAPVVAAKPAAQSNGAPPPATTAITGGAVVLTANDAVWVKIYDADNKRLFESEMKAGDSFTVPADAKNPMIVTGRPQALTVTVGGKAVAALGAAETTIKDVGVSSAALLARKPADETAAPAAPSAQSNVVNTR
jgi:cytoskeleton protein RodZ